MLYERGREAVAMAGESVEDLVAEIRAEDAMPEMAGGAAASDGPTAGIGVPGGDGASQSASGIRPRPGMAAV